MPKVVDHGERRERIVTGVWDQLLDGGFEAVTLRRVAERAEISMGQVQHYFASRQEMIHAALTLAAERLTELIQARLAAVPDPTAEQALRAMLTGLLGLTPEGRRWVRISAAILGQAVFDQTAAEWLAADGDDLVELTVGLITAARAERGVAPADRPDLDAELCWSVATSLGIELALGQRTAASAEELLDHQLQRILG